MESVVTFLQDVVPQVSVCEHRNGLSGFGSGSTGILFPELDWVSSFGKSGFGMLRVSRVELCLWLRCGSLL